VHLGTGVVEGRDTQEDVLMGLVVMGIFNLTGMLKVFVG
jgi:hypothetical protein